MVSHAGWTEITAYTGNRPAWTPGAVATQSVSNTASPAAFTINATVTIAGSFLSGVNTGTGGRLYSEGNFTAGNKVLKQSRYNFERDCDVHDVGRLARVTPGG